MAKKCCPKFSLFEFTILLVPIVKLQLIQAFDIIDKSCNWDAFNKLFFESIQQRHALFFKFNLHCFLLDVYSHNMI